MAQKNGIEKVSKKSQIKQICKNPKGKFLTESQEQLWNELGKNEITLCFGPAGVGKSHIIIKKAIELLIADNNYEKIVITRPAVQSGEEIGYLPGPVDVKMYEFMYPSFYLIKKIIGEESFERLQKEGFIDIVAFSFMRGLNIDNSILICEEAQNISPEMMKTLLTRIGFNSKFFISGDLEQSDKYFKAPKKSGFFDAKTRLTGIDGIGMFEFKKSDVVRNKLITDILERYDSII